MIRPPLPSGCSGLAGDKQEPLCFSIAFERRQLSSSSTLFASFSLHIAKRESRLESQPQKSCFPSFFVGFQQQRFSIGRMTRSSANLCVCYGNSDMRRDILQLSTSRAHFCHDYTCVAELSLSEQSTGTECIGLKLDIRILFIPKYRGCIGS